MVPNKDLLTRWSAFSFAVSTDPSWNEINETQKSSLLNNLRELDRPALSKLEAKCKSAYEDALDPSICDNLMLEQLD